MLELVDISKTYSGRNGLPVSALRNVNIKVCEGEFVSVVGPSGSGKSTLLFVIGAMLRPTEGQVVFNSTNVYGLSAGRRASLRRSRIGFVFQTFNLIPYLTCLENVVLPAILAGETRQASVERAKKLLDRLGLSHRLSHRPAELSVGERQRVALCRSTVNRPRLLLADEPTGNLDVSMRDQVSRLLRELNAEGQTIITVTHDPSMAKAGTRVLGLREGMIKDE